MTCQFNIIDDLYTRFLAGLKIGRRGKAFILDGRRRLVAVPDVADLLVRVRGADGTWKTELRKIQDSPQKALAALETDSATTPWAIAENAAGILSVL